MATLPMSEQEYLSFYRNTALTYSKQMQRQVCDFMNSNHLITFEEQSRLNDNADTQYFASRRDLSGILTWAANNRNLANVFEYIEFTKLYKYSVPFFYRGDVEATIKTSSLGKAFDYDNFEIKDMLSIGTSLDDANIITFQEGKYYFIKLTIQKNYFDDAQNIIDYRYPIVLFFDVKNSIMEIRYDAIKYGASSAQLASIYERSIKDCLVWAQERLDIKLFICDAHNLVDNVKSDVSGRVKIFKQMMELSSGGAAELTASQDQDYMLPFIGELRELIDENEELFNSAVSIKELLLQYLEDKEATANYPYIYIRWLTPIASENYSIKFTFNYFLGRYPLLQHLTGNCKDLRMERMNNAIKYFCESASFVAGEEI